MLVTFSWHIWLTWQATVFTKKDGILIKVLRQSKGYSARKLLVEFPDKDWSCSALDRLRWQIDAIGPADRNSDREHTVCTSDMQMSVQMATTLSTNCNWWYCVRTAKATFPYWKLLFLSYIFQTAVAQKLCSGFCWNWQRLHQKGDN